MAEGNRPDIDLSDLGGALRRLAGDVELLQEIAESFLEQIPVRLDALDRAIASGDPTAVAAQARALRDGIAPFCGGNSMRKATLLEVRDGAGGLAEAEALLAGLKAEFRDLQAMLIAVDWGFIGALPRC